MVSFFSPQFPTQPSPAGTTIATTSFPKEIAPFIKDILEKSKAQQVAAEYDPYTKTMVAPFTEAEKAAMTALRTQTTGLAGTDVAQAAPYYTGAKTAVEGLGQQFTGDVVQQYMNPYQQAVTDQAVRKAEERYTSEIVPGLTAQAIQAQPFGGSRQAIREGMAADTQSQLISDLQERGLASAYQQGRTGFEAQKARELGQAQQYAQLGQTVPQQALRDLAVQQQLGEQERQLTQQGIDLDRAQFLEEREFPTRALQEYSAIVRGFPFQPSTYTAQTQYQPQPSVANQLLQLGAAGMGAFTAFNPKGVQSIFGGATGGGIADIVYNNKGENRDPESIGIVDAYQQAQRRLPQNEFLNLYGQGGDLRSNIEYVYRERGVPLDRLPEEWAPKILEEAVGEAGRGAIGPIPTPREIIEPMSTGGLVSLPVTYKNEGDSTEDFNYWEDAPFGRILKGTGEGVRDLLTTTATLPYRIAGEATAGLERFGVRPLSRFFVGQDPGPVYESELLQAYPDRGIVIPSDEEPIQDATPLRRHQEQAVVPDPNLEVAVGPDGTVIVDNIKTGESATHVSPKTRLSMGEGEGGIITQQDDTSPYIQSPITKSSIPDLDMDDTIKEMKDAMLKLGVDISGGDIGKAIKDLEDTEVRQSKALKEFEDKEGVLSQARQTASDIYGERGTPEALEERRDKAELRKIRNMGFGVMGAALSADPTQSFVQNISTILGSSAPKLQEASDTYEDFLLNEEDRALESSLGLINMEAQLAQTHSDLEKVQLAADAQTLEKKQAVLNTLLTDRSFAFTAASSTKNMVLQNLYNQTSDVNEKQKIGELIRHNKEVEKLQDQSNRITQEGNLLAAKATAYKSRADVLENVNKITQNPKVFEALEKSVYSGFGVTYDPITGEHVAKDGKKASPATLTKIQITLAKANALIGANAANMGAEALSKDWDGHFNFTYLDGVNDLIQGELKDIETNVGSEFATYLSEEGVTAAKKIMNNKWEAAGANVGTDPVPNWTQLDQVLAVYDNLGDGMFNSADYNQSTIDTLVNSLETLQADRGEGRGTLY